MTMILPLAHDITNLYPCTYTLYTRTCLNLVGMFPMPTFVLFFFQQLRLLFVFCPQSLGIFFCRLCPHPLSVPSIQQLDLFRLKPITGWGVAE